YRSWATPILYKEYEACLNIEGIMDRAHTPPRRERPDPDALFSGMDQDSHQEMIQTMRQLMENLTMDRARNRHDRRERSASIASIHRRHSRVPTELGS
ncbi:hypothetical protein KI387_044525, partial [Taxus chinensis]